ncbi:iron uptake system protein EfeO [Mycolicibacterium sp. CBMA 226]|uniref:iron uptake system protein EfeO n=1 Tax=Mycolicibacterium sp. CBMA 226 TaxID=2606611 RepID=UPI0012DD229A|nr:iron uptake system protein EfeO [Mycolicibacterium sp. CBMA 226]MUL77937.1 peptidase M75 family protein [Mycolicibacterium sp. CBMA 226]
MTAHARSKTVIVSAALLAGLTAVSACTSKSDDNKSASGEITVTASDDACKLSATSAKTGPSTFIVTNNGTKVTEFYVYGPGDKVMGEIENVSPGLQRKLIVQLPEAGTYKTACKPGMVGDGIRGDFTVTGDSVKIDDTGKFKDAADFYKKYVVEQTTALVPATQAFVDAVKKGDVAGAKALYPKARTYYERIEPVAESFPNELDPRIDLREADVRPGDKWTGFHRLEKELWVTGLQPDSGAVADQLLADVKELDAGVKDPKWTIDSTKIAGGAQGLLDEIAKTKISGEEDIFSHTDLWDFQANVDGSRTAVGSLDPILDERDPSLGKDVDAAFDKVQTLLDKYRQGDGFVSYDKVTEPQRQELSQAIDALSKEVSEVQGVVAKQ